MSRYPLLAASRAAIALALFTVGCQAPVAPRSPLAAGRQAVAMGQVTVDAASFGRAIAQRRIAGAGFREVARITQARLIAEGPDMAAVTKTIPWLTEAPAAGQPYLPPAITVEVPVGQNRVFTFQALDEFGHVLAVVRGLGPVTAGEATVTLNAATDAAARVLAALNEGAAAHGKTDTAGITATLPTTDLTATLQAKVDTYLGYDAAANTFSALHPLRFRHLVLADALWQQGPAALETAIAGLDQPAAGSVAVTLMLNGAPATAASVTIFDPTTGAPASTDANGQATFTQVPPGTWAVRAQHGNYVVWGRVTVRDNEAAPLALTLGSQVVFDDAFATGWQAQVYGAGGSAAVSTADPHAGTAALLATPNDSWLGIRHPGGALNPAELNVVTFALKSDAPDTELAFGMMNEYASVANQNGSALSQPLANFRTGGSDGAWRTYRVPLAAFGSFPSYHGFIIVRAGAAPHPTIALDAVSLEVADAPARGLMVPLTGDAAFGQILSLLANGGRVLVTDRQRRTIHSVDHLGRVSPFAGADVASPVVNGPVADARFLMLFDMARGPNGRIYVSDNNLVRQIEGGMVSATMTPSNGQLQGEYLATDTAGNLWTKRSGSSTIHYLSADGQTYRAYTSANTYNLYRMAADGNGNVYFLDATGDGQKIYRFAFNHGALTYEATPVAGSTPGSADGHGAAAQFNFSTTSMLHADAGGTLTLADGANGLVRRISPTGHVTTLTLNTGYYPHFLTVGADGTIYVANQSSIRKVVLP